MEQSINTNPRKIPIMPVASSSSSDQIINGQVMEIQEPDSMPRPEPEPAQHSKHNVDEQDLNGGDDMNDGSEDEDDLLLAPLTANQLICILCGTRVASTARLRRHTVNHHPEAAEMLEFLIETAVKIFPGIYAKTQAQTSNPTTSNVNCAGGAKKKKQNDFHRDAIQPESEISTSIPARVRIYNSGSTEVSTKFLNVVTAPKGDQSSAYFHAEKKPFKCEYCVTRWTCKSKYDRHLRTHTGERPFVCQECDKGFKQMNQLNTHMKIHTREKPFICQVCSMGFSFESTLKSHMRTHTRETPFVCKQCNKALSSAQGLRIHAMIHTRELPFPCPHCDKKFRWMAHLKEHLAIYSGERAFQCTQCGKTFGYKCVLTDHLRVHSGERPYTCDKCPKTFPYRSGLHRHRKTHHGEKPQ